MSFVIIILATSVGFTLSCSPSAPGSSTGGDSGQLLQDPTFKLEMHPPVSWTYHVPPATTLRKKRAIDDSRLMVKSGDRRTSTTASRGLALTDETDPFAVQRQGEVPTTTTQPTVAPPKVPVFSGQWSDPVDAKRTMNNNVRDSVYQSLTQVGYGLAAVSYEVSGVEPVDLPTSDTFVAGAYKVVNGAVVGQYGATEQAPIKEYKQTLELRIKNGPVLTRGQWTDLGARAQNILDTEYMAQITNVTVSGKAI